jgi:hypothetical protein
MATRSRFSPVVLLSWLLILQVSREAAAALVSVNSIAETTLVANNVNANRANDILVVGNTGGAGFRRSLISFGDVASLVGPGQQISSATMTLTVENINGLAPGHLVGVFRAARAWSEGAGSGSSGGGAPFGATWNAAKREGNDGVGEGEPGDGDGPIFWTNPGGDFVGTTGLQAASPYATASVVGSTYAFDVTSLVQGWYDGSIANNGVMVAPLTTDTTQFGRVTFKTSDQSSPGDSSTFPRLDIEVVPEPAAWLLAALAGACGLGPWSRRRQPADLEGRLQASRVVD